MDRIEIVVPNNAGSPAVGRGAARQTTPRISAVRTVGQMLLFALILLAGLMALVQAGKQSAFLGELPVLGLLQSSLLVVVFLGICALVLFSPVVFLLHYLRRERQGPLGRALYTSAVGLQVALMVFAGLLPALAPSFVTDLAQQTPVIGDKLAAATDALLGETPAALADANPGGAVASTEITGTVFQDYNANGIRNTSGILPNLAIDAGVAGISVTAYISGSATAQGDGAVSTDASGRYTITGLTTNTQYRIEFTNLPAGYYPTTHGTENTTTPSNGTTVQFAAAGTSNVSLGINRPCDYCQDNPEVMTTRMRVGVITGTNISNLETSFTRDWANSSLDSDVSVMSQTGSMWGVAYDRDSKLVYGTAFLKRQSGLGPRGLDGVYAWDYSTGDPVLIGGFDLAGVVPSNGGPALTFGSVTRIPVAGDGSGLNELSADPAQASRDDDAFGKVGTVGFGDADVGPDGKTLWSVNLLARTLIAIDTSLVTPSAVNPNPVAGAAVKQYQIVDGGAPGAPLISGAPTCVGGQLRPFGLGFDNSVGYLGAVCDGSSTAISRTANVVAYVLSFDPAAPINFSVVASTPMTYTRESSYFQFTSLLKNDGDWQGWFNTYSASNVNAGPFGFLSAPQPILSDIDVMDDGSLALGFVDRWAHQQGWYNFLPGGTTLSSALSTGDILRAYKTGNTYVIEGPSNDSTDVLNYNALTGPPPPPSLTGFLLDDGPNGANGGEFFYGDQFTGSDAIHGETSLGGVALLPGSKEVLNTVMDPTAFFTQGFRWYSTTTGNQVDAYSRAVFNFNDRDGFGKGAGLGDLEVLCDAAPLEIGNRLWDDQNGDGIQDPGEPGLNGVQVQLVYNGEVVSTTTTFNDANGSGQYYFNLTAISATLANVSGTQWTVRVPLAATLPANYVVTNQNTGGQTSNSETTDQRDSDGDNAGAATGTAGQFTSVTFTTQGPGSNNHTLDFGFEPLPLFDLGNRVWYDTNNDGVLNNGEQPVGGVTMTLRDGTGSVIATTATNASGYYSFTNLVAGTYTVTVAASNFQPGNVLAGYWNSTATTAPGNNASNNNTDHGTNPATYAQYLANGVSSGPITLGAGLPTGEDIGAPTTPNGDANNNLTIDFGFYTQEVGNTIWVDANNDGLLNNGELPYTGGPVTVALLSGGNVIGTVVTNNGIYTFSGVMSGNYVVSATIPNGFVNSTPTFDAAGVDDDDNGAPSGVFMVSAPFAMTPGTNLNSIVSTNATGMTSNPSIDFGLFVPRPDIQLIKYTNGEDADQPSGPFVAVGSVVRWTYEITNTGNVTLTNIALADDREGVVATCPLTELAPRGGMTCILTSTATAGQYANTATVTGTPTLGPLTPVTDTNPSHYFGGNPGLVFIKYTNGYDADTVTGPQVAVGSTVTWTYVIINTGSQTLTNVTLSDDKLSALNPLTTGVTLAPGAVLTVTQTGLATAGQYANTGTVTGTPPSGPPLTATNPSHYYGVQPGIQLIKYTNGYDADTLPLVCGGIPSTNNQPCVAEGSTVTWTYVVTNTGNVLLNVAVGGLTDDRIGAINTSAFSLAAGASTVLTKTGLAVLGQYSNTGVVTGTPVIPTNPPPDLPGIPTTPTPNTPVTDTNPSHYFATKPSIVVIKYTNGADADLPTGPLVAVGATVTWTYDITNTGNVTLTGITLVDNIEGGVSCPATDLPPGVGTTCVLTGTAITGQYANTAVVTGTPTVGPTTPVTDTNPSHYIGVQPPPPVLIGDHIWLDNGDPDGIFQPTDTSLAGVPVTVTSSSGVQYTTVTDANGLYTVTVPANATYTVVYGVPAGLEPSATPAGTNTGDDTNDQSHTNGLAVTVGTTNNLNIDFALVIATPTAIKLARFTATQYATGVRVEWQTSSENDTLGFHLFRGSDGEFANALRLTEEMIFGQGSSGGSYAVEDLLAQPGATYWYWLVETQLSGAQRTYGPVSLTLTPVALELRNPLYLPLIGR